MRHQNLHQGMLLNVVCEVRKLMELSYLTARASSHTIVPFAGLVSSIYKTSL
ncbi:Uncharacterised protein [Segatella copri]|nr:Uncharacterised protein [Segatella copri]